MSLAPHLALSVLGPLRVRIDGEPVPIAGRLKHRLLARLALYPGEPVSADGLIEALWGDEAPGKAKQSLHVHISHLRDRLRPFGAERLISTAVDGAYTLGDGGVEVDAIQFERAASAGLEARRNANLRSALDSFADAAALWGQPYESLANHYGSMARRQGLVATHEHMLDAYVETFFDLEMFDEALPVLRSIVADEPLREGPYRQLLRVYRERGEAGPAQLLTEEVHRIFRENLGVEPELEDAGRNRSRPSVPSSPKNLQPQVHDKALIEAPVRADLGPVLSRLAVDARAVGRTLVSGRVTRHSRSPLSPITEMAGLGGEPGTSRTRMLRSALFDQLTHRIVLRHGVAPVVVIAGLNHAELVLIEYLEQTLLRPGPDPFTLIGIVESGTASAVPESIREFLGDPIVLDLATAVAPNLADVIESPVDRLVIELLSVASLPVPTELIARATNLAPAQAATHIDRLVARRHVWRSSEGLLDLHEPQEVQSALEMPPTTTAMRHVALAEAYQADGAAARPANVVAAARHLLAALPGVDWDDVVEPVTAAVEHLDRLEAYADIAAVLAPLGDFDLVAAESSAVGLRVLLGKAQIRAGQIDDAVITLQHAIQQARQFGLTEAFADAVRWLSEEQSPQRHGDSSRELITEALELLGERRSDTWVQLMTDLGSGWYFEDNEFAIACARRALDASSGSSLATRARAQTGFIQAIMHPYNAAQRLDLALQAQHLARQANSTESLVLALTYEANALFELGEPQRADPPLRYAEALAEEARVPRFQWWAAAWRSLLDFALGDLDRAEERFVGAFELWPGARNGDSFECFASQIAMLRLLQGRASELAPIIDQALDEPLPGLQYLAVGAFAQSEMGDHDAAATMLNQLVFDRGLPGKHDVRSGWLLALAAEAAYLVRETSVAQALLDRIEPIAHVHTTLNVWGGGGFYWGSLHHCRGLVLHVLGRTDEAGAAFQLSVEENERAGATVFASRSRALL